MATAKELVVGTVWGFISGDLYDASAHTIQDALNNPITITGPREERWALTSSNYFSHDRQVNGALAKCGDRPWRAPMVPALTGPGKLPSRAADREPERVIPDTYVLTSGRGLHSVAALTEALAKAKAREDASERAREARIVAAKAATEAANDLYPMFPGARVMSDSDGRVQVTFPDAEAFREFCERVTPPLEVSR